MIASHGIRIALLTFVFGLALFDVPALYAGEGFDRAIDTVTRRVIKLYGLGAGLEAGYGTGVVVSTDGLVLTVPSLLIDARKIRAVDCDGRQFEADVLHRDVVRQLALLRVRATEAKPTDARPAEFPDFFDLTGEGDLQPGDWVLAAGNAFKVAEESETVSIAHGIFSTRTRLDARRRVKDFPYRGDVLVIDAITSNPGGPGSALVNLDGELVGMIGRQVTSNLTHTHFNYAMPRNVLRQFVREATDPAAMAEASTRRDDSPGAAPPELGIRIANVGYKQKLAFVERVRRGSPAALAGVRKDDLVLAVGGRNITDADDYHAQIKRLRADESVDLVVRRGKRILTLRVEPEKR